MNSPGEAQDNRRVFGLKLALSTKYIGNRAIYLQATISVATRIHQFSKHTSSIRPAMRRTGKRSLPRVQICAASASFLPLRRLRVRAGIAILRVCDTFLGLASPLQVMPPTSDGNGFKSIVFCIAQLANLLYLFDNKWTVCVFRVEPS